MSRINILSVFSPATRCK